MTEAKLPKRLEADEVAAALKRLEDNPNRLRKVSIQDGALTLEGGPEAHARFSLAFGSTDLEFQTYCLRQLIQIVPDAHDEDYTLTVNAAVAMLAAIAPQNEMEAMLAVQMVASHHLSMLCSARTKRADQTPQFQANGNMASKFARTHAAQVEALSRLRRGGEQVVRHVHVNEGGQALIAGTVNTGGAPNG